ncbi:hypothetical protein [Streptococcus sp. KS 6]|jgi:hypothetical protein|uniref:hypothetical protein n=1 Tax=Streptococcus sp. KS 6 TaxID=2598457 RepID=UPI00178544F7|nr:hypothetical protein [Streptococcus sp. KS 6]QOG25518.1 hypothetical protein FPL13_08595 [Streptococcus sp. KS 6]
MARNKRKKKHVTKIRTSTGFEFVLDKKRLNNYELVEALGEMETHPLYLPKVVKLLLGDQAERLKDHVRDENGIVDTEKIVAEVKEIFKAQPIKN